MEALLRLAEVVDRAPDDDLATVAEENEQRILEVQEPRPAVDDREHVDAERLLHRGVLVELVQEHVGDGVALEIDDDAHPVAVGFIA